jgi:hypothetical protein
VAPNNESSNPVMLKTDEQVPDKTIEEGISNNIEL